MCTYFPPSVFNLKMHFAHTLPGLTKLDYVYKCVGPVHTETRFSCIRKDFVSYRHFVSIDLAFWESCDAYSTVRHLCLCQYCACYLLFTLTQLLKVLYVGFVQFSCHSPAKMTENLLTMAVLQQNMRALTF